MTADNRQPYLAIAKGAIRFRQGEKESTVVSPSTSANPLIKKLITDIIEITKVKQWLLNSKVPKIIDNTKKETVCMNTDLGVAFEQLKIK